MCAGTPAEIAQYLGMFAPQLAPISAKREYGGRKCFRQQRETVKRASTLHLCVIDAPQCDQPSSIAWAVASITPWRRSHARKKASPSGEKRTMISSVSSLMMHSSYKKKMARGVGGRSPGS